MKKATIVYWSSTGNTEAMAQLIYRGLAEIMEDVNLFSLDQLDLDCLKESELLILGCPSMGDEVLEEDEFQPFMDSIYNDLAGKKIGLFGSYGWGDGQWMRDWEASIKASEGELLLEPIIVNSYPEDEDELLDFGRKIGSIQ